MNIKTQIKSLIELEKNNKNYKYLMINLPDVNVNNFINQINIEQEKKTLNNNTSHDVIAEMNSTLKRI